MPAFRNSPRRSAAQGTHSLRNAPRIGFDPRKLETELLVWLRADMGVELNGSTVEGWDDQSGNGNDFEQTGDASAQPDPETGLGGRATVYFDSGNGEFMSGPSLVATVSAANDWTIVVVANDWEWGTHAGDASYTARKLIGTRNAPFVPGGTNVTYFSTGVGKEEFDGWCGGFYSTGSVHVNAKAAAAGVEGIPVVYMLIDDGGDLTCRLNGIDGTTVSGAGSIQAQAGYMDLAGWSTIAAGIRFGGTMSEVLIFDGALSDGDMASLETYLSERYTLEIEVPGPAPADAFQAMVEGSSDLACWWSPNGAGAANLATGDEAMAVMNTDTTNPAIKARVTGAGDWEIVADNIGTATSLTSAVEANLQRRDTGGSEDNFCGIDNAVSMSSALSDILDATATVNSGFVFFKPAANVQYQDILVFKGDDSSGQTANMADTVAAVRMRTSGGDPAVSAGATGTFTPSVGLGTFSNDWWYIAWTREEDTGPTDSDVTVYAVMADGSETWDDVRTATAQASPVTWSGGLTFGHASSHAADGTAGWRWGPIGLFDADIGVGTTGTTLRTIFEAIE